MVRSCQILPLSTDVPPQGELHSLPQLRLEGSRAEMLAYFENTWALTELLFSGLANEEAFYRRPYHKLRHPMIFYYAHPVVLYVNKLRLAGLIAGPVRAEFEALFETGVDEMRWDDLYEGAQDVWPPLDEVQAYRREVYGIIHHLIQRLPEQLSITQQSPLWALVMGFEHERIHLETSSVLIRELPVECVQKPEGWPAFHALKAHTAKVPRAGVDFPENSMVSVPECEVTLGKPRDFPTFGWDNEYGAEVRRVQPFGANKYLISNGEFYAFVAAGGLRARALVAARGLGVAQFPQYEMALFLGAWWPGGAEPVSAAHGI